MIKVEGYIPTDDERASPPLFSIRGVPRGPKAKNWASLIDALDELGSANDRPAISPADGIVRANTRSGVFLAVELIGVGSSDSDLGALQGNL